jgi:SagB-type dehydrogenase family enzyme
VSDPIAMPVATVRDAAAVYGELGVDLDDPAELYHEASKLYPSFGFRQVRVDALLASRELRVSATRAGKRFPHLPLRPLPDAELPPVPLADAIRGRASGRRFGSEAVTLVEVAALLWAAYGLTGRCEPTFEPGRSLALRTVPSGGALYPLDIWLVADRVEELPRGLFHVDPEGRGLAALAGAAAVDAVRDALVNPSLCAGAAATVVVSGTFWRSRFKYGLRGYRFTLLEAGHVVQNLLLAATSLGLAALPVGGFFDSVVDEALELNGVDESALYLVAIGRRK